MKIPETLQARIKEKRVVPFIGAGVSAAVRHKVTGEPLFPTWKALLLKAASQLEAESRSPEAGLVRALINISPPNYLMAAQYARDGLGSVWYDLLNSEINPSFEVVEEKSLELARSIWTLGSSLIITTNYDRVLHWTCPTAHNLRFWDIESPAAMLQPPNISMPTVWHLHGWIDNPGSLILTNDGFSLLYPSQNNAEVKYKAALEKLRHLLAGNSILFIGFSLNESNLGIQLTGLSRIFQGATGPHYAIVHESEMGKLETLGLPINFIPIAEFGAPLVNLIQQLAGYAKAESSTEGGKPDPSARQKSRPKRSTSATQSQKFNLDAKTAVRDFDPTAVKVYRDRLRPELSSSLPITLDDNQFVEKIGCLQDGFLTVTGVLLFTQNPSMACKDQLPSAVIQCTRYNGTSKSSDRKREVFDGPILEQIIQSRNFVTDHTRHLERPTADSMQASKVYEYPMICVREVIANAVCHRDYNDKERLTYIRIFDDRIEIASPGSWLGASLRPGVNYDLSSLASESIQRNILLAHAVSRVSMVEMEGSGVSTAVFECRSVNAPMPVVTEKDGYVIVKVFPRANWDSQVTLATQMHDALKEIVPLQRRLAVAIEKGDRYEEAILEANLGSLYGDAGQYEEGIRRLEKAASIAQELGDEEMRARVLYMIYKIPQPGESGEVILKRQMPFDLQHPDVVPKSKGLLRRRRG